MNVRRLSTRLLLRPGDFAPSREDFEVVGAFNPGAVRCGEEIVLLVRIAERPRGTRKGHVGLPRFDPDSGATTVDWVAEDELEFIDPRVVRRKSDGIVRLTFVSHLRVVRCGDGRAVRSITDDVFRPENELEEFGVEDPRITFIDNRYYITYVCVSRHGPATALASTLDFRSFERHGVVFCTDNKDVTLFPEKIGGRYAAIHRPVCGTSFTRPEPWIARSPDLIHWGSHEPLIIPDRDGGRGRAGAGAPPFRVADGWLEIYHGNIRPSRPGEVGAYHGAAILLDSDDPARVLKHSSEPFLVPEADFEVEGFVPNVVFPTGTALAGDELLVYYGAADAYVAVASFSLSEILNSLIDI